MDRSRRGTTVVRVVFYLVLGLCLLALRYDSQPALPATVIAYVLLAPYLLAPPRVHRQSASDAHLYEPFDLDDPTLPEGMVEKVDKTDADLRRLGFDLRGHFRKPTNALGVTGYVSVFENPRTLDAAKLILIHSPQGMTTTLVFLAEFADGREMNHSASRVPRIWPRSARQLGMTFPDLDPLDAGRLYAVHRARVAEHFSTQVRRLPPSDVDLPERVRRDSEAEWLRPLEAGYYWHDEEHQCYRPTWKGACLMAWKLTWPVKQIRTQIRRTLAARELRRLGLA